MALTTNSKPKVLPAVNPNQGLQAAYRRKLDALIEEMHASILYWVRASYRANEPAMAQDASPAATLRAIIKRLTTRWQGHFNRAAPALAKYFATAAGKRADGALEAILAKAGFSVKFKMTAEANDVMQATIGEQVGLIRSISQQYLGEVEGLVMRSVATGRDLATLSAELEQRYGITKRRAALIARDQNNKATSTITRARQQGLGIEKAVWMHSHAGKEPRPSHVAMNGKSYDISKGMWDPDERKYIWPGTEINCRCTSRPVIPGFTQ